jgi:uncharacterized protein (DUF1697 family)
MAELRAIFERLGATDVQTYIQSGNVIFVAPRSAADRFAESVEAALLDRFGLDTAVVVRNAEDLKAVLSSIPYPKSSHGFVSIGFFKRPPTTAEAHELASFDAGDERAAVVGGECYLLLPHGTGRAKLPARLNRLSAPVTIRNLRTVTALAALASKTPRS